MSSVPTYRKRPTAVVALGTALVLVTYVTLMATVRAAVGPAKLVDGWSSAVVLASVVSTAGALVIAANGGIGRTGAQPPAHVRA